MAITGRARKCALTIQSSKVDSTLSDFPVLLTEDTLPAEMLNTSSSHPAQSGGGDIRFSSDSAGTTELAHEIVDFTPTAGGTGATAEIWVKVTSVSSSTDTDIYIWYDTTGTSSAYAATDTYGRNAVWSDYWGVYHGDDTTDATGNSRTLSINGTSSAGNTSGKIRDYYKTVTFQNNITHAASPTMSADWSIQAWLKNADDTGSEYSVGFKQSSPAEWIGFGLTNTGSAPRWKILSNGETPGNGSVVATITDFVALTLTHDSSANQFQLFVDGALDYSNTPNGSDWQDSDTLSLGEANGVYQGGEYDEVRVREDELSADWIDAEYNNQNDPATFVVEGTPSDVSGGTDALTPNDVSSNSEVDTPALGQTHALTPSDVESASEVDSPALGQVHALTPSDVESSSEVGSPAISGPGVDALTPNDVQSQSEVDTPVIGQVHVLTAEDVESASTVDNPALVDLGEITNAQLYSLLIEVHKILGLDATAPMTVTPTSRTAGNISQTISGDGVTSTTVKRD